LEAEVRLIPRKVVPSRTLIDEVKGGVVSEQNAELEKLRQELSTLRPMQENQIGTLAKLLTQIWLTPSAKRHDKLFFDDPVWGHTCMDEELGDLFFHPLIQRLNHIKQLSFAYLRFPNATHSRLAHTLGTCRTIETSLTTMFRNNWLYKASGRESIPLDPTARRKLILKAKTAALLHDVGHAPFGHTLDKFIGYFDPAHPLLSPDKHYSRKYFNEFFRAHLPDSIDAESLAGLLGSNQVGLSRWDTLVADLLDSPLDADRMDFLVRDAHMTGLMMGVTSTEALIERMCPFQEGDQVFLTFEESCLPYVKDFLVAREEMYALCYEHPPKLAAERIFTRLVENLRREHNLGLETIVLLTDEQILALLGLAAVTSVESSRLLSALLQNIKYETVLEADLTNPNERISSWNKARHSGRMGHLAYVDWPSEREREIAIAAGLGEENKWRVLVAIPDQRTGVPHEINAKILEKTASGYGVRKLFDVDPKMRERLKDANKARQRIRVFADLRLDSQQIGEVERAAKELLESAD
jgi:HD superfamily phosphohydrolase